MASDLLKKTYRFLISRQFAVWSLIALAVLLIVGGTLPDISLLSERELAELQQSRPVLFWVSSNLHVYQLTRSPLFLILSGTIWLSIALCMVRRLRREIPKPAMKVLASGTDLHEAAPVSIDQPLPSVLERIRTVLEGRRWLLEQASENGAVRYFARKGTRGFWGSVVFHLSMLVFLLGIIVSALARFDAEMVLTEGQTLALAEDRMLRINGKGRLSPALPGTLLTLSKFESRFEQDKYPVDFAAHLKLADGSEAAQEKTVRVNQPLRYGKWQIFLHRYGFAPRFELLDEDSRLLFDAFVNLIISRPEQEDYIDIPSQRLRIETRFFPDYRKDGEKAVSLSGIPKNPVMLIRALEDGESIGERYVPLGETAQFGEYRLTFAELRYWAWFGVVHDPGYGFIIVGFVLCVAGLVVRFVVSERWLRVVVEEKNGAASVTLSGRSRYFPAFFEKELESIRRQLQTRVDSATIGMERGEKE